MPGPSPIVKARVEPKLRALITATARSRGLSESELLRQALQRELADSKSDHEPQPPDIGGSTRLTIRLSSTSRQALTEHSNAAGMAPSRWIASLVQSHVSKTPVLTRAELLTLEAALRELAAIGRNINQIARALNQAHFETERVRLDYLGLLSDSIAATREEVRSLVRASRNSWGTSR